MVYSFFIFSRLVWNRLIFLLKISRSFGENIFLYIFEDIDK